MKFVVWIVAPEGDQHWRGLEEVARGIEYSLRCLGHQTEFVAAPRCDSREQVIVFNAHRLEADTEVPAGGILFNSEQVSSQISAPADWLDWWTYVERFRHHAVWDYSEANVALLKALGVERVVPCAIGYWPGLSSVRPTPSEDIDVLFYGSVNARRDQILKQLYLRQLHVQSMFGLYGRERDEAVARAKVVLNVHFYAKPIFEIFRCSHLFANRKCVVSESGGCDPVLETLAAEATALVPYGRIVDECEALVKDAGRRREIATKGFEKFSKIDQVAEVKKALEASL